MSVYAQGPLGGTSARRNSASVNLYIQKLILLPHHTLPVVDCKLGNTSAMNTDGLCVKASSLRGPWSSTPWFSLEVAPVPFKGYTEMWGGESHYFMTLLCPQLCNLPPQ